jgi:hypothetical protein
MKSGSVSLLLFATIFFGCNEEDCPPCSAPTDDRISFEMNFLEYSDNNYFINEVYADTSPALNLFNLFYGNIPPVVLTEYYVKEIEVYKSVNVIGQSSIYGCAYIDLPPRSASDKYPDSLRYISYPIPGQEEVGRFCLLSEGRDYLFHPETGYITFTSTLNEQDIIAIAYRIENDNSSITDDLIYGEFFADLINNSDSIAVLRLVKPRYLKPQFRKAWKLKMRNIYQFTPYLGQATNIDLDIYLKQSDGTETNSNNNKRLLELFGFDKLKETGSPGPDGKFDDRIGYTYERRTSELIFPMLQPFGDNIPTELNDFKYDLLYDTLKVFLSLPENYFVIEGKYRPI